MHPRSTCRSLFQKAVQPDSSAEEHEFCAKSRLLHTEEEQCYRDGRRLSVMLAISGEKQGRLSVMPTISGEKQGCLSVMPTISGEKQGCLRLSQI